MNSLVRSLPTESIETILTLEMPCNPHSQNKNLLTSFMTSSIRHQFFEFSQGDRPDFPLSNFKKKTIFVLSLLSSFRSGLCTNDSKILTRCLQIISHLHWGLCDAPMVLGMVLFLFLIFRARNRGSRPQHGHVLYSSPK